MKNTIKAITLVFSLLTTSIKRMFQKIGWSQSQTDDFMALTYLRQDLDKFHTLLRAENFTFKLRTGVRIRRYLEGFLSDLSLKVEAENLVISVNIEVNSLSIEKISALYTQLFDKRHSEIIASDEVDYSKDAHLFVLMNWVRCKLIKIRNKNTNIGKEAEEMEEIFFFHMKSFVDVERGKLM